MPLINPQRNGFGRDSNTGVLIRFNSTSAPDVSYNAFTVTETNMNYSAINFKFFPCSGIFSNDNVKSSYLNIADSAVLRFGTSPWTVDFWTRFTVTPINNVGWIAKGAENAATQWSILYSTTNGIGFYSNSTPYANTGTTGLPINTWHHVAFVFDKTNIKSYINGLLRGTSAFAQNLSSTTGLTIGRRRNSATTNRLYGYMDEIRLTNGLARWKSSFQVPNRGY